MTDLQRNLSLYLTSRGWTSPREPGTAGRLWDHSGTDLSVAVPFDVREGTLDWRSITERLAEVEGVSAAQVVAEVRRVSMDVANLRAANDLVITDTIPYEAAITMMHGGWRMFRSCATTAMRPRSQIKSAYNKRAEEIVETARMAHTQKGSFIIPLLLPVSEPPEIGKGLVEAAPPEPIERRVMRTFAQALSTLDQLIVQPAREVRSDEVIELVFAGVSAEFTQALHTVLAEESVAEFSASFDWAPIAGPEPEGRASVAIPAGAAPLIQTVTKRLRKAEPPMGIEVLTGPIVEAKRGPERGGIVIIDTMRNARNAHVGVRVTEDELFDNALDWMRRRTTVEVRGHVQRQPAGLFSDRANGVEPRTAAQLPVQ